MEQKTCSLNESNLLSKRVYLVKRFHAINSKDAEKPMTSPHVLGPHGAVLLLSRSVQDVQHACLLVYDHLVENWDKLPLCQDWEPVCVCMCY